MRRFVVSLIASGGAVLAVGLATTPVTAASFPASAVMPQDEALARGTVILAGPRYLYGSQYYPPYYGDRSYYRRYNGYRPYYPGYYRYRPYYAPLSICGTLLCYRPKYFIAPAW
jgi:hypothetical protein